MRKMNYYTIYNSRDEIIASGTAEECSKQMNTSKKTFFSIISKNKKNRSTYKVITDIVFLNEKKQIIYDDN